MISYIADIEDFIELANERNEKMSDLLYYDATLMKLTQIAERAKMISEDFRVKYPNIPWTKIIGFRNRAVHEYEGIKADLFEDVLSKDLPSLKKDLYKILEKEEA